MVDIDKPQLIKEFLETILKHKIQLKLWQSIEETKNFTVGTIEEINTSQNTITLSLLKGQKATLEKSKDLFFHSTYKDLLFKAKIRKIEETKVVIASPNAIKLKESRSDKKTFGLI
jgi:uncharacterized protein (DUF488 family)